MKRYALGLCLVALLALASTSQAATYYVSNSGSNAVSCATATNEGTPKQTLVNARACLAAGDVLDIRGGTYLESLVNGFVGGTSWGTAVTYKAHTGETVIWQAKDNPVGAEVYPLYMSATTEQYVIFERIVFDGANRTKGMPAVTGNWGPSGAHHIRFLNCEFRYGSGEISLSHTHHNEFIGGSIHDGGDPSGYRHGIYLSSESADNLIEGMDVYNNTGFGIHLWTDAGGIDRNIIRSNRTHHNGTATGQCGILYTGGVDGLVYNNIAYANGGGGICVGHGFNAGNIQTYNNTVYGNFGVGGLAGLHIVNALTPHTVKNNISYNNGTANTTFQAGTIESNNLIGINPLFVNVGVGDFHLQAGSPAIDAGVNLTATIPTDHYGTTYTVPMEIGAINYGTVVGPNVLVFTSPPTTTILNATMAAVTVCVNDSAGVRQTGYATNISLAIGFDANPTTTLTGGTGGAPTSGCRSFPGLSLNKTGTGFTLQATSGALTKLSGPFNSIVQPTAPIQLYLNRVPSP